MKIKTIRSFFIVLAMTMQLLTNAYANIPEQQIVATYKGSSNSLTQLILNCREYIGDQCTSFEFIQRSIYKKTGEVLNEKNIIGPINEKELRTRLLYTNANSKTVFPHENPALQVMGIIGLPIVALAGGLIIPGILPIVVAGLPVIIVGAGIGLVMLPVAGIATGFVVANYDRKARLLNKIVDDILQNRAIQRPIKLRQGGDYNSLVKTLSTKFN